MNYGFWLDDIYLPDKKVYIGSTNGGLQKEEFLPPLEYYTDTVTGMHGRFNFGQVYKERKITIPCYVDHITRNEKYELQRIFTFSQPKKLIFDDEPFKYIHVLPDGQIDWERVWYKSDASGLLELQFVADDPRYYSYYTTLDEYDEYNDIHSIYSNTDLLPSDIPNCVLNNITNTTEFSLFNHGNCEAQLITTIDGSGSNISITNTTTGQNFIISSLNSQEIVIDGIRGKVTIADTLATNYFDGDFIELNSGMNNLKIDGTDLNLNKVSFLYRHTYI
jgi:predicted phage tail component-like protein